jgi:hypothetical protein
VVILGDLRKDLKSLKSLESPKSLKNLGFEEITMIAQMMSQKLVQLVVTLGDLQKVLKMKMIQSYLTRNLVKMSSKMTLVCL